MSKKFPQIQVLADHAKEYQETRAIAQFIARLPYEAQAYLIDKAGRTNKIPASASTMQKLVASAAQQISLEPFETHGFGVEPVLDVKDFVKRLLTDEGMSVVYGDTNTGKTFFALDLALHVAMGREWYSRPVTQGAVLYVAAEGTHAIHNRVAAFRRYYGDNSAEEVPFRVVSRPVNLRDETDCSRLRSTVEKLGEDTDQPVRLVVIDTLSRALAGGDENNAGDMTAFINTVDHIREHTGAHVMLVHHTGKNPQMGARGHSSLKAAVDTEINVTNAATQRKAEVTKQRDLGSAGDQFKFGLREVTLGKDQDGAAVTSCVCDSDVTEVVGEPDWKPDEQAVLDYLKGSEGGSAAKKVLRERIWPDYKEDTRKRKLQRALKGLGDAGMVEAAEKEVRLTQ